MHLTSESVEEIYHEAFEQACAREFQLSRQQVLDMLHVLLDGEKFLSSLNPNWAEELALNFPGIEFDVAEKDKTPYYFFLKSWNLSTAPALSNLPSDVEIARSRGFALINEGDRAEREIKNFLWMEILAHRKIGAEYQVRRRSGAR